jgi:glycosyltransferase involved in cell wall biosynthesis
MLPPEGQDNSRAVSLKCADHPWVSIVVATRGFQPALVRCIESLLAQGCQRREILIVLNGHPDGQFMKALAAYPVRTLTEPRRGLCAARNAACLNTRGEILVFIDDDAAAHPGWLHELIKGFQDPRVACVTGRVIPQGPAFPRTEANLLYYHNERACSYWTLDSNDPEWFPKALGRGMGYGCNLAFRRNFLEKSAAFPEDMGAGAVIAGAEEYYMFVQVLKHGFRIAHTPAATVTHFFEKDLPDQKRHTQSIYAASVAFTLKLLTEEGGLRWATIKAATSALMRALRHFLHRQTDAVGTLDLLSGHEKLTAYWRGVPTYWKARKARIRPRQEPHA